MNRNPKISISGVTARIDRTQESLEKELAESVLLLVQRRCSAYRTGNRDELDATYVGIRSRDHSLERAEHERVSYYDWYMNRIEAGLDCDIVSIHVQRVNDLGSLLFKHNANWTIDQPDFELKIETEKGQISWFVRSDILYKAELKVVLPTFSDPPWKAPIVETRGGSIEFNSEIFSRELGRRLGLEFCCIAPSLDGLVKIRAFGLVITPFDGMILPGLLTDNENFDEAEFGKWSFGNWRFFQFTRSPSSTWPYGDDLCECIRAYTHDKRANWKHPKLDELEVPREEFDVLVACAASLKNLNS